MPKRLQKSSVKKRVPVRSVSKIKTYQSSEKPDQVGEIWQNNIIGSLDNGYSKEQARKQQSQNLTERQKRKIEEMQSNPEMIQAREELKEEFLNTHPQYAKMTSEELQESMTHHALEDEKLRKQKLLITLKHLLTELLRSSLLLCSLKFLSLLVIKVIGSSSVQLESS